jgi:ubiquinone/menaquinone biosynthesis C-methylase UbiE
MILNRAEKMLLNNPIRRTVQRHYEIPLLLGMSHRLDGTNVLEIGCGQGFGMELIFAHFGAATVTGIDLDRDMIALAQRRIRRFGDRATVAVGDVTAIDAPDEEFDAVFDFGIIHHVPVWQNAIREVRRVLKPGGLFLFEEVSKQALARWIYRTFFDHPAADRFTIHEFAGELNSQGILVHSDPVSFCFGDFFAGVGTKTS